MINIAFFEDHPIVIDSLINLFCKNDEFNLVFYNSNKIDFYKNLEQNTNVDVVIIDILAVDVQGLEIFEFIGNNYPKIKQIAFTTLSSPVLVENLLSVGVKGYVNKNQNVSDLIAAISVVNSNRIYLPKDYYFLLKRGANTTNITTLTDREIEIMQLIIMEYTTSDISNQLKISINTVENHRKNIFQKLDVKNVAGMVREASKLGYIN